MFSFRNILILYSYYVCDYFKVEDQCQKAQTKCKELEMSNFEQEETIIQLKEEKSQLRKTLAADKDHKVKVVPFLAF